MMAWCLESTANSAIETRAMVQGVLTPPRGLSAMKEAWTAAKERIRITGRKWRAEGKMSPPMRIR
jgi:hypothetical protein